MVLEENLEALFSLSFSGKNHRNLTGPGSSNYTLKSNKNLIFFQLA